MTLSSVNVKRPLKVVTLPLCASNVFSLPYFLLNNRIQLLKRNKKRKRSFNTFQRQRWHKTSWRNRACSIWGVYVSFWQVLGRTSVLIMCRGFGSGSCADLRGAETKASNHTDDCCAASIPWRHINCQKLIVSQVLIKNNTHRWEWFLICVRAHSYFTLYKYLFNTEQSVFFLQKTQRFMGRPFYSFRFFIAQTRYLSVQRPLQFYKTISWNKSILYIFSHPFTEGLLLLLMFKK